MGLARGSCSGIIGGQQLTSVMVAGLLALYIESWVATGLCTVLSVLALFLSSLLFILKMTAREPQKLISFSSANATSNGEPPDVLHCLVPTLDK